ncbi:hypothetical protein [Lacticaseibacillus pantheris]|uniref:hypothetical protein n=1 Tax=Lacticaseibacillus pantheris TaxID=171523 RepID=UPI002657DF8B|nr:hypothetical protein [Lacticaseibacillus pantheris]WKF86226.1 hypothetical protein QY874_03785 [Lacticaseibacillus pantheris]
MHSLYDDNGFNSHQMWLYRIIQQPLLLLFAEHIRGTGGLIVGIPVITFLLDILVVQRHAPMPRPVVME